MVATQAKGQDVLPAGFDVIFNLSQEGYGVFVLVLCLNKLCNRLDILLAVCSDTWIISVSQYSGNWFNTSFTSIKVLPQDN